MSGKYLAARNAFAEGSLSWRQDRIVAQLVSANYRFDEAHTSPDDLTVGVVGDPVELVGKRINDGWLQCNTIKFPAVTGDTVVAVVFYRDEDSKPLTLIEYHDAIADFPMTPDGVTISLEISEPGIFRI